MHRALKRSVRFVKKEAQTMGNNLLFEPKTLDEAKARLVLLESALKPFVHFSNHYRRKQAGGEAEDEAALRMSDVERAFAALINNV